MKNLNGIIVLVLACIGLFVSSCQKDEDIEGCIDYLATNYDEDATVGDGSCIYSLVQEVEIDGVTYSSIQGSFTTDYTLTADTEWLLNGVVTVSAGQKLTIEEGAVITSDPNDEIDFLVVENGATISAEGTSSNPIVFTSLTPEAGSFGGVVINGNALTNNDSDEGACGVGSYGGSDNADDAGKFRYIRVEYGGGCSEEGTSGGIVLNAVGEETKVEYIQSYRSAGDGIVINGGSVNLKYAVAFNSSEDNFDFIDGWRGKGQYWVGLNTEVGLGDSGIESDNNETNPNAEGYTKPTISNVILIGTDSGLNDNAAVRLSNGTKGNFYNFMVKNYSKGVQVEGDDAIAHIANDDLSFEHSIVKVVNEAFIVLATDGSELTDTDFTDLEANTNSLIGSTTDSYIQTLQNGATDPTNLIAGDDFFETSGALPFIGAVLNGEDWTEGWAIMQ